ncbi:DUF6215 domain-containing protein [Kitasatospora sp. NPDC101176]|uniref:DUF6215 domain-containing protein n=1 Tax=Kitasatospora sp. NPDC101176 TaxID=3364099 RepID=UPI0037F28BAC
MENRIVVDQDVEESAESDVEKGAQPVKDRAGLKLAAVAVVAGAVVAGMWGTGAFDGQPKPFPGLPVQAAEEAPVMCAAPRPTDSQGYAAVCAKLNRPDLPALLGTPDDRIVTAHPMPMAIGKDPMVEVRLKHAVVGLMEGTPSVDDMLGMPQFFAKRDTVLGHPAARYSSSMLSFVSPSVGSGAPTTAVGPATRNLVVAEDPGAPGGRAFEIIVARENGSTVDDEMLNRLAETLLPTLPGWVAS